MRTLSFSFLFLISSLTPVESLRAEEIPEAACVDSRIDYDTSTLEKIIHTPEQVLRDEQGFWRDEKAQVYTEAWARNVNVTISREKWRRQVASLAEMTDEQQSRSALVRTTASIVDEKDAFLDRAIPHVCAYLPEDVRLDIPVHFTAFIPPRSMVTEGVVINVAAPYWKDNPDNILNNLMHEMFHVGYSHLRKKRTESPLEKEILYGMLDTPQNEGIATWVGYEARSVIPAPDEIDYRILENPRKLTRLLGDVNAILAAVDTTPEAELRRLSWKKGVTGRAYYIVGAHMAERIQTRLGKDALIQTIVEGPVAFATLQLPGRGRSQGGLRPRRQGPIQEPSSVCAIPEVECCRDHDRHRNGRRSHRLASLSSSGLILIFAHG
jgi:hypothetical protein